MATLHLVFKELRRDSFYSWLIKKWHRIMSKDPRSFFLTKKKSNWFCNRGLSPTDDFSSSDEATVGNDQLQDVSQAKKSEPLPKIIIQEVNCIKPQKINWSPKIYLNRIDIEQTGKTPETSKEDHYKTKSKAENLDDFNINKKSETFLDADENEFIPSTPEDPFHATDSELSNYEPSDEDTEYNELSRSSIAKATRSSTFKKKNYNEIRSLSPVLPKQSEIKNNSSVPFCSSKNRNSVTLQTSVDDISRNKCNANILGSTEANANISLSTTQVQSKKPSNSKWTYYKRKPDYCYFCETEVQNFGRHVIRNHSSESEVSQILSKPVKSKERRHLLNCLRKKGNFLASGKECFKAVRQTYLPERIVLPCDNCLGYFSSKLLYRHRKKCLNDNSKNNAQAAAQTKLIANSKVDRRLKEQVFPRMRADKVSMEAKNDILICAFGARYLNTHREKHFVNVTSRKMRELAKILIELKNLDPSITNLFTALRPKNFDLFVEAAKRIGKYDVDKDVFLSPTFAMNISTSLKQCCDIAITYAYKKQVPYLSLTTAEAEADLKTLVHLFETNWKYEISSQAANNLDLNRWNKVTVIPLASDLRLLRKYLLDLAEDSAQILKDGKNIEAYNKLTESVYCRVILLNRKRSGELQRMLLHTYVNSSSEKQQYEEFNKAISSTEQILLKSLRRVIIRGKRGRGVPVLFSSDVQNHIQVLLQERERYIAKDNPYLFAKTNSAHIIGYKVLNKYAKCCGAKNPDAITSTRLRKHLATLSQLFNLSDNEIEQLATFMGHTPGVHRGSYRLPDEIYQTAKISKLLLLMEKGGSNEFKGKSLDEINLNLEKDLLCDDSRSDENSCEEEDLLSNVDNERPSTSGDILACAQTINSSACISRRGKVRTLVPWTKQQKRVAKEYFKNHIKGSKPPKRAECEEMKGKHPQLFENKDWLKIKVFIQNEYNKKRDK